jgi:hypothetical protein
VTGVNKRHQWEKLLREIRADRERAKRGVSLTPLFAVREEPPA